MLSLPLHSWPGPQPSWQQGILLIGTRHKPGTSRAEARVRIRQALGSVLAQTLSIPADAISFPRNPGNRPRVLIAGRAEPGLSISHEGTLSVAALNLHGAVGIDLMQVQEVPDWETIACDYLGPRTTRQLQQVAEEQRPTAFAQAWCLREAMLKCAGLPLVEWSDTTQPPGRSFTLDLPATVQGVVVLPDAADAWAPGLTA
ncbi:4'-phosphopantetheinyl transferase family protein [Pseudomonas asplenii]|uniref:4'-phosphopantetheinyl transferase n=1 Tax=Pseudomonas asplenii TaxID=53407 RepID=A0A1H6P475_9PSED|nr:4'-phosphopantetheinyl transferase superfamily protein [Pseudomonas fuscovaginae]SEI18787.1 4'-phosphopantetheinyl transferase [Pseudomonas fuscovaginae]